MASIPLITTTTMMWHGSSLHLGPSRFAWEDPASSPLGTCLRMVLAWQPVATACVAICRAYHTSEHVRAPLLQRAVGPLPARVPCLRVARVGLAPRRARRIVRVGGRRRIDDVANGGGVQPVGAAREVDQVRQGFRLESLTNLLIMNSLWTCLVLVPLVASLVVNWLRAD